MRQGLSVAVWSSASLSVCDGEGGAGTQRCQRETIEEVTAKSTSLRSSLRRCVSVCLSSHGITVTLKSGLSASPKGRISDVMSEF